MDLRLGLENFKSSSEKLKLGIVTNATGVTQGLVQNVDFLKQSGMKVARIFSPEHGFYSSFANGEDVPDESYNGIPVKSLYKENSKEMNESELDDLDALVFDIQDAGVRFYTYLSTLYKTMETAKKKSMRFILLDRPNPLNAHEVNGPMIEDRYLSFVGIDRIPVRYGLTVGELARFFDRKIGLDPEIVKMSGYNRKSWYDNLLRSYVPLSWNLPTFDSVINYSGMCLLECVDVSLGRGTPHPFSLFGFPGLWSLVKNEYPGVNFRKTQFGSLLDPQKGVRLEGYYMHITDRKTYDPLRVWGDVLYDLLKSEKCNLRVEWLRLLYGSDALTDSVRDGVPFDKLASGWKEESQEFMSIREDHLLY